MNNENLVKLPKQIEEINSHLDNIESLKKSNLQNFYDNTKVNLILAGIDSLTNGAGNTKYLDFLSPRLRGELGDGGAGWCPFDYQFSVEEGYGYGRNGMLEIATSTFGQYPSIYSLDLKGAYSDNANNGSIDYSINRRWTNGKLYYLIQPNGGTFRVGYASSVSSSGVNIDTNGSLGLGVYQMPINNSSNNGQVAIRNITGKVVLFGVFCYENTGVIVSRIGKGGDRLSSHNSINSSFMDMWLKELKPKLFIFNGGTNDRNDLSDIQYQNMITSYLASFLNNNVNLMLIRPQCIQGDNKWELFDSKLKQYCLTNRCDYISNKDLLGNTYELSNTNGYMLDGVHPSVLGNKKIANNILQHLGIPIIGSNITNYGFSDGNEQKIYTTNLSTKNISVSAGSSQVLYLLGLTNGTPNGLLEVEITGTIGGTSMVRKKIIRSVVANGSTKNAITTYDATPRIADVLDAHWGSVSQCDFNVSFATVDGKLQISVLPNSLEGSTSKNMFFTADGKITLTYNSVKGQSVFEN